MSVIDNELTGEEALRKVFWEQYTILSIAVPCLCVLFNTEERVIFPTEDKRAEIKTAFVHWEVKQG